MDYSAVGQTTHLAARMEQLATPGSILLTATTLRLVEGLVRVNAPRMIPIKDTAEPWSVRAGQGHYYPSALTGGCGAWPEPVCRTGP